MILAAAHFSRVDIVFGVHRLVIDSERAYYLPLHALFAGISWELELEEARLGFGKQVVSRNGLVRLACFLEFDDRKLKLETLPILVSLRQSLYSIAELDESSSVRLSQ
jgi:hypothetical protein